MHLVKAFEKLLSIDKLRDSEEKVQEVENARQLPEKVSEMQDSSSFCPSEFLVTLESLGLDSRRSCSLESSQERESGIFCLSNCSFLTQTSAGSRRSGLSSPESTESFSRRHWRRRTRTTSPKPFMLRTERENQRERIHEEIAINDGRRGELADADRSRTSLDNRGTRGVHSEPSWHISFVSQCLVKPPVKENTRPIYLVLHTDIRAVERAGFDQQVAKKISLLERYRMEIEKQQKATKTAADQPTLTT